MGNEPKCRVTGALASEVPEYVVGAEDYDTTPSNFVKKHDESYDSSSNTFVSPDKVAAYLDVELGRR